MTATVGAGGGFGGGPGGGAASSAAGEIRARAEQSFTATTAGGTTVYEPAG